VGQGQVAAAQGAGQFEGHDCAHAVAEEGEGFGGVGLDGFGERFDERRHSLERRFGETGFAARQPDADVAQAHGLHERRPASGVREPEEARGRCGIVAGEPGRGRGALAQADGEKAAFFG
jgi:hypothetical protein